MVEGDICAQKMLIVGIQALEGKDVKDLLLNVGSGGGAAAPTSGGAAAGGDAPAESAKEEEKEEGSCYTSEKKPTTRNANCSNSQGGVRRGYGFRSFRLSAFHDYGSVLCVFNAWMVTVFFCWEQYLAGEATFYRLSTLYREI